MIESKTIVVFAAEKKRPRRWRRTALDAYRDAAQVLYLAKYPCPGGPRYEEPPEGADWSEGWCCALHGEMNAHGSRFGVVRESGSLYVVHRLGRWLRWRAKRSAELGAAHCEKHDDCNEPKAIRAGVGFACAVAVALEQPPHDLVRLREVLVGLVADIDARLREIDGRAKAQHRHDTGTVSSVDGRHR
jgi:hypothetical protein